MFSRKEESDESRGELRPSWIAVLSLALFAAACTPESHPGGGGMRPVQPPEGTLSTAITTVGEAPMITTAGSPSPYANDRERFEPMTIVREKIMVRNSLPAINVPFRIRNEDAIEHVISVRTAMGEVLAADVTLAPGQEAVLVMQLRKGKHQVICTVPRHSEQASFSTYSPR